MKKCPISVHRAFFRSPYVVKTLFFTKDGAFFRSEELATLPKPPPSSPAKPSSHTLARGRGVWVRHSSIYYIRGWGGGGEKGEGGRGKMVPASSSAFFFRRRFTSSEFANAPCFPHNLVQNYRAKMTRKAS